MRSKYNFKTEKSDSELLLYYLIDNINNLKDALSKLDGMFCFALYDSKDYITILGRDFIGRLPLYYSITKKSTFISSSEVKGISQSLKVKYYNCVNPFHSLALQTENNQFRRRGIVRNSVVAETSIILFCNSLL